ncbi:MAG: PEP-CTERM sorting domain-containing protein [Verrucomicrobiota bacterium]|jgi:hypothetical protein
MKFPHLLLRAMVPVILVAPLGLHAQVFSHDFTQDPSGAPPSPFYTLASSSGTSVTVVNGTGLELNQTGTGKVNEEFAQFITPTPITLATVGDYITFTAGFNGSAFSGNNGALLAGLYNTMGTVATGNLVNNATGGATADDQGYFGMLGLNTGAGNANKFYSRTGGASDANELGYYSSMTSGSYAQVGSSFTAPGNANLANSTAYTLTYTVTKGASGNTITAEILQGATVEDNWSVTDASSTYNSFDELMIGFYSKSTALSGNITSVAITDSIAVVPEPATCVLAGVGMLILALWRRARR